MAAPSGGHIELLYAATPNGWKISVMMEELRLAGVDIEYTVKMIDMGKGDQFTDWFKKVNPNSKMPAILDYYAKPDGGYPVFESGAILEYLGEKYGKFFPTEHYKRWEVKQWLYWQMAGLGPMVGQAVSFGRYIEPVNDYAIERYTTEGRRLLEVLDKQLEGKDWICGDFSIADIASWPWARAWKWAKIDADGRNTGKMKLNNVLAWIDRMAARPGVQNGLKVGPQWNKASAAAGGALIARNENIDKLLEKNQANSKL